MRLSCKAERPAQQPGPRSRQYTLESLTAAPVCCSGWFGVPCIQHFRSGDVVGDDVHSEAVPTARREQLRRDLQLHLVLIHADLHEQPQGLPGRTKAVGDFREPPIQEPPGGPERFYDASEERLGLRTGVGRGIDVGEGLNRTTAK